MKRTKPVLNGETAPEYARKCVEFCATLPDEFTVLEEVWPKELTSKELSMYAQFVERGYPRVGTSHALGLLANIAPGPRKRKVTLWQRADGMRYWGATPPVGQEWERRGECEIEEG
jgi:hypothetical protein